MTLLGPTPGTAHSLQSATMQQANLCLIVCLYSLHLPHSRQHTPPHAYTRHHIPTSFAILNI